jgi:hypothetical protein
MFLFFTLDASRSQQSRRASKHKRDLKHFKYRRVNRRLLAI